MGLIFSASLLPLVLDGSKSMTRRPKKPGDTTIHNQRDEPRQIVQVKRNGRALWTVGGDQAIIPGRGKHGVGRLTILAISSEDVRNISLADVYHEGFKNRYEFWQKWTGFYDPRAAKELANVQAGLYTLTKSLENVASSILSERPANLYDSWVITFERML
jgi:hypothetical protein